MKDPYETQFAVTKMILERAGGVYDEPEIEPKSKIPEKLMSAPIPIDFSNAWKSSERIVNNTISLLPNLIIAVVIFIGFLVLASTAKAVVRHLSLRRQRRKNLSLLLGQLTHTIVLILGFLVALSVVAPSFQAGDLIKMLGIGSVAIGFAFQNILQNFLAGLLILMQEPFTLGDWISVTGIEGRVDDIQTRATVIITQEGKRVIIPNAILFTNPVAVGESHKSVDPGQSPGSTPASL